MGHCTVLYRLYTCAQQQIRHAHTCTAGLGGSRPLKLGGSTSWMRAQYDSRTSFASVAIVKRLPCAGKATLGFLEFHVHGQPPKNVHATRIVKTT